jgi:myo-inositol-1(or 4)-monophosphatase
MSHPDPANEERAFLRDLALRVGAMMLAAAERTDQRLVQHKAGEWDLVTDTDRRLEEMVFGELVRRFPGDGVVAEEGARRDGAGQGEGGVWYIDPLDGTTNFVHGYPFYAVSIGRWVQGAPQLAAVYAPALDELYLAQRGQGAFLERPQRGAPPLALHASACVRLQDALLATGFPYVRGSAARVNLACCAHALAQTRGLRRGGAASLDLCHVGAGRLDGFWELTLKPWDVAAGALVALEAGARVTDFTGGGAYLYGERLCAAAPGVHGALLQMIAAAHRAPEVWPLGKPLAGSFPLTKEEG